jgi:Phage integrase, N-terminal SAM-like domain
MALSVISNNHHCDFVSRSSIRPFFPITFQVVTPHGGAAKPRLLDQVREKLRHRHYSLRTERAYADWIRRFILFHQKRHPAEMGAVEIEAFLTHLAIERHVSASTQN